jgi:site-specific DNA-methyltransferase (adenine-specific)
LASTTKTGGSLKMVDDRRKPKKQGDDYPTPAHVYNALNEEFDFDDDPCPLGAKNGGLSRDWGSRTYLNPPYSNPTPWCQKAVEEMKAGKLVVGLLRGDVSAGWFHDYVLPFAEVRFVRGRISFEGTRNMHGSIIIVWDGRGDKCSTCDRFEECVGPCLL